MAKKLPSFERVREVLDYDPRTGILTWRKKRGGKGRAGAVAGCISSEGRIKISIDGVQYKAHRIIWLWMTGHAPSERIDHRDMNQSNNAWVNLRLATNSENMANRGPQLNNKSSGLKGAYRMWHGRWYSRISKDGIDYYLGIFDTAEEARAAYIKKAEELYGEFARAV
jgi:HNH endonuclease